MSKRALVTGGNGFIGSHMCRLLHDEGYQVLVIDNHSTSPLENIHPFAQFEKTDVMNKLRVSSLLKQFKPDVVFHFAGKALVGESEEQPFFYYHENVVKGLIFIETCQEQGIKDFIFSSSCATFGEHSDPITEGHPQNPINSYGQSKLLVELLLKDLARHGRMNSACLRYFNVAGCSPDGLLGENHEPETHLIPNILKSILAGESVNFTLYGDDYPTRDGSNIRDYIHVDDLCRAHLLAYKKLAQTRGYLAYNLGSGHGMSNKEMIQAIEKVTGKKIPFTIGPRRPGDPPALVADPSSAKKELGFTPFYTLEDMINHTYHYLESIYRSKLAA